MLYLCAFCGVKKARARAVDDTDCKRYTVANVAVALRCCEQMALGQNDDRAAIAALRHRPMRLRVDRLGARPGFDPFGSAVALSFPLPNSALPENYTTPEA